MSNLELKSATVNPFVRDEIHFGFDLSPEINAQLQRAAALVSDRGDSLQTLLDARKSAPEQLEILVALYKFYFYQGETRKAEDVVFQTLLKSAQQGGFPRQWERLTPVSTDWENPRGPGRIYLYSLKALAFIRLRQNDFQDAENILDVLGQLDSSDQVGADVIRDLLAAMVEETDE